MRNRLAGISMVNANAKTPIKRRILIEHGARTLQMPFEKMANASHSHIQPCAEQRYTLVVFRGDNTCVDRTNQAESTSALCKYYVYCMDLMSTASIALTHTNSVRLHWQRRA